jgi:site-specific DNA-methyltransferase (adenine-specific)
MSQELFPVEQINIEHRVRDGTSASRPDIESHLEQLCSSIERYGLLQPILLDQTNTLVDGWCRFTSWLRLRKANPEKYNLIPVYRRDALSPAEYFEVELETNLRRLDLTWRETIKSVCAVHTTRSREAAINRTEWTQEMTGELLGGYSRVYVTNCLTLAPLIVDEKYNDCTSITDALRVYYRILEDKAIAEQARRTGMVSVATPLPTPDAATVSLFADDELSGGDVIDHQIDLSHSLFCGDCREVLAEWPADSVDHIITDPPFAIDLDVLDQSKTRFNDISRVKDEHEVDENINLLSTMMAPFYRVLRDGGYFIHWCDQMQWQYLYTLAESAGFRVQRWPLVWCKPQALNQMAHINITKATEIAMVCRKGKAQLPKPVALNWEVCSNDAERVSNQFAKPFHIWKYLYEAVSTEGQTVLDPFAGEGSGVISGLRLNRRVLSIEKNTTHFSYQVEQVKDYWKTMYKKVTFV